MVQNLFLQHEYASKIRHLKIDANYKEGKLYTQELSESKNNCRYFPLSNK